MKLNKNFSNLVENYLFADIATKVNDFLEQNPNADIIRLGIGDVTRPLCTEVVTAMKNASDEMGHEETFRGYGPYGGYDFLKMAISNNYLKFGVKINEDEIFVSDGAKCDVSNILDLFDKSNKVLIPDPVYPVYVDTNIMDGREILYINANETNNFLPLPDFKIKADIIYLCSPNNPTGAVYNKDQLKIWVNYALQNDAIILFDAAYESFITSDDLPHSIFEIEGAKKCAIEFCSFSKTAGFTGIRCGYAVVPKELVREDISLNKMWGRRQCTKFNGVSYVVQRGAEAVFSVKGQQEIKQSINYYKQNAQILMSAMNDLKFWFTGGKNSPYVWFKCPDNMISWNFFDFLLKYTKIVGTPGSGFGKNGEFFFRLTAFCEQKRLIEATQRLKDVFS